MSVEKDMSKVKYNIIEKNIKGIEVNKFIVETLDGSKRTSVDYDDVIKLARSGKLGNADALIDVTDGNYLLSFNGELKNIREHKQSNLQLLCRLINPLGQCIGYKLRDESGKTYKLSINKVWELASYNSIDNIKACFIHNKKVLKGINGYSLDTLPKMQE